MFEFALITFITIAITEIIKRANLIKSRRAPIFAVAFAGLLVTAYGVGNICPHIYPPTLLTTLFIGASVGLSSCGLYSLTRSLFAIDQQF